MDTLDINNEIRIPMTEISITAVRAQGSGGQNVNKVATAIHLRFDSQASTVLPDELKTKILQSADQRINSDGVIVIKSQDTRSQTRNRAAALQRLVDLLRPMLIKPKPRLPTRPSKATVRKRLDDKSRRGALKQNRKKPPDS